MVLQQWSSFVNFLIYLVVSIPLLLIGIKIFMWQTPYTEMQVIKDAACCDTSVKDEAGIAVAHSLGGKVVGVPGMVRGLFTEGGCDIRFGAGEKSPAFTRRLETAEVTRVLQLRLCRLRQVIVQIRHRRPP